MSRESDSPIERLPAKPGYHQLGKLSKAINRSNAGLKAPKQVFNSAAGVASGSNNFDEADACSTTNTLTDGSVTTIDDIALAAGMVVLLTSQTDATQNGLYNVNATGAWSKRVTVSSAASGSSSSSSSGSGTGTVTSVSGTSPISVTSGTTTPVVALTGVIAAANMPALTGDVTSSAGSVATTVVKANGISMPSSVSSGGIPFYSSTSAMASTGTLTQFGVVLGGGAGAGGPNVTAAGTNGQILVGVTSANPAFVTLGGDVTTVTSAGVVTLGKVNGVSHPASGTSGGILYFSSTSAMTSTGALTQHGVVFGGGAGGSPTVSGAGTNGQILVAVTSADPAFVTLGGDVSTVTSAGVLTLSKVNGVTFPASFTSGGIPYASSSSAISSTGVLTANGVVYGGGAGVSPGVTAAGGLGTVFCSFGSSTAPGWTPGIRRVTGTGVTFNSTTLTNIGDLSFNVVTGQTYCFFIALYIDAVTSATGWKLDMGGGTASGSCKIGYHWVSNSGVTSEGKTTALGTLGLSQTGADRNDVIVYISGWVTGTGAPDNIVPRVANSAAGVGSGNVAVGSWGMFWVAQA